MKKINLPMPKFYDDLIVGEQVYLTGYIYTARDAAHSKLFEMISSGEKLPIELNGACIYYAGPTPAKPGRAVGSCGPTTSKRMDKYAPAFYDLGVNCVIGKGPVSTEVKEAIIRNGAVYFAAVGGVGALLSRCMKSCEVVALNELLSEAIHKIYVEDMPVFVAITKKGNIFN